MQELLAQQDVATQTPYVPAPAVASGGMQAMASAGVEPATAGTVETAPVPPAEDTPMNTEVRASGCSQLAPRGGFAWLVGVAAGLRRRTRRGHVTA
jgi:hypothetical protein